MNSRPIRLLPFESPGAEQLRWNAATDEIVFFAPAIQTFVCAHDRLHRIEIYLEPRYRPIRCQLWLKLRAGDEVIRLVGPLASDCLLGHGWFSFEFEAVAASAGKILSFALESPDALPGNAFRVRCLAERAIALTFRALCLRAPELFRNFCRFRNRSAASTAARHAPLLARLEISRPCNLGCIMCYRGINGFNPLVESPAFMSFDTARQIDPFLSTLLCIIGFGLGEPFLNPDYMAILRHIRKSNPHAWVFASTNGTRLGEDTIREIVAQELFSHLQVSIDGADRETYESVRRGGDYGLVRRTLDRLLAERERPGGRRLIVKSAMLVMKPTAGQIGKFVRQMAGAGVDEISLDSPKGAPFRQFRLETEPEMAAVYDEVMEAQRYLEGSRTVLEGPLLMELRQWHAATGRSGVMPESGVDPCTWVKGESDADRVRCELPWQSFTLATDGSVRLCCNSPRQVGLSQLGIEALWRDGPGYGEIRSELLGHRPQHAACTRCLEENVAKPEEITPPIFGRACLAVGSAATVLAQRLGRPIGPDLAAPRDGAQAEIESLFEQGSGGSKFLRISGWLRDSGGPVKSTLIGVAVNSVLRGWTAAEPVGETCSRWTLLIPGVLSEEHGIEVLRWNGESAEPRLERLPLRRMAAPEQRICDLAPIHGFIDEVVVGAEIVVFRGWARHSVTRCGAERVMVTADGVPVQGGRAWFSRPDVAETHGGADPVCGFQIEVAGKRIAGQSVSIFGLTEAGSGGELSWGPGVRYPAGLASRQAVTG